MDRIARGIAVLILSIMSNGIMLTAQEPAPDIVVADGQTATQLDRKLTSLLREHDRQLRILLAEHRQILESEGEPLLTELIHQRLFDQGIVFEAWLQCRSRGSFRSRPWAPVPEEGAGAAFAEHWLRGHAAIRAESLDARLQMVSDAVRQMRYLEVGGRHRQDRLERMQREVEWNLRAAQDRKVGLNPRRIPQALADLPSRGRPGIHPLSTDQNEGLAAVMTAYWNAFTLALAACRDAERRGEDPPQEVVDAAHAAWAGVVEHAINHGDFRAFRVSPHGPQDRAWRSRHAAKDLMDALIALDPEEREADTLAPLLHDLAQNAAHMELLNQVYRRR
ncbi:MAG: hypothetical protein EA401_03415 [Planctomycetota bacterium]|nr:MAG: hypothetical protein EA401_03415 [Planctomycetota bacterium]